MSLKLPVDHAAFSGAHGVAQGGAGLDFALALSDLIDVGERTQDPCLRFRRSTPVSFACPQRTISLMAGFGAP
jgi:hypothetical protein